MSLSAKNLIARGESLWRQSGTAWEDSPSKGLLQVISEYADQGLADQESLESQLIDRRILDRGSDITYVSQDLVCVNSFTMVQDGKPQVILELPKEYIEVDHFYCNGEVFDKTTHFEQVGNRLLFEGEAPTPLPNRILVVCASKRTSIQSAYWSKLLRYRDDGPDSLRYYRALVSASQRTYCVETLTEFLGACLNLSVVTQAGVVERIGTRDNYRPVVVTDKESIHGVSISDLPTVSVGDTVYPGDTVFDSLRVHDFSSPPPSWLNELAIPKNYFLDATDKLTIDSTPKPALAVTKENGITHFEFPWEGEDRDVQRFNQLLKEFEKSQGESLLAGLFPAGAPLTQLEAMEFDWLYVLWLKWLRNNVSVSVVRDRPDSVARHRLAQIRRIIPPWKSHLIQYLDPPREFNELC